MLHGATSSVGRRGQSALGSVFSKSDKPDFDQNALGSILVRTVIDCALSLNVENLKFLQEFCVSTSSAARKAILEEIFPGARMVNIDSAIACLEGIKLESPFAKPYGYLIKFKPYDRPSQEIAIIPTKVNRNKFCKNNRSRCNLYYM